MRTLAIESGSEVAVVAEHAKVVREIVLDDPVVEVVDVVFFAMLAAASIDVVDGQEFLFVRSTTGAFWRTLRIVREDFQPSFFFEFSV